MLKNVTFLTENQELISLVQQFILDWNNTDDFIYTHTSGSTGKPKEIKLYKKYMVASALASGRFFNFQEDQRIRLALSPKTIGGKMLLLRGLLFNMQIEVVEPSKNPLSNINSPIDFISMVPYQLEHILKESPNSLQFVKTVLLGGAPVSSTLENQIQQLPCQVFLSYGMTETMSHVALCDLKRNRVFQAIEGVLFDTNDANQLLISAPNLGIEHLITNDVVELISSTSFVWKGRADFVINSAGIKIHPELIEKKLAKIIKERFFIIGEKDPMLGERVVLVVEGKLNTSTFDFNAVLGKYEIPKQVYFIQKFVETDSGKINRLATKQLIDATKN